MLHKVSDLRGIWVHYAGIQNRVLYIVRIFKHFYA